MFENMTFEYIINSMLDKVPNSFDKREGSIIYDAIAPCAIELANIYTDLDFTLNQTFADTSSREYLIKRAKERGIFPYEKTSVVVKGVFNTSIPINSRFSMGNFNYIVTDVIDEHSFIYKLVCETKGSEANGYIGDIIPIQYIEGLKSAKITEIIVPARDDEDTEKFRQRYFNSLNSQAFGGNIEDYKIKVNALEGVGGCKIYPVANGGGTVTIVVINSEYKKPSDELIENLQTIIDPVKNSGLGLGIAPIGHIVTVLPVNELCITITTDIIFDDGYSFYDLNSVIKKKINDYFNELNKNWANEKNIVVRISQIESRIIDIEGIIDISNTSLNGEQKNIIVDENYIIKFGSILNNDKY